MHWWESWSYTYPRSHWHSKLPGVFIQRPWVHMVGIRAHSSISSVWFVMGFIIWPGTWPQRISCSPKRDGVVLRNSVWEKYFLVIVLTGPLGWTLFARATPCGSHGTTAQHFRLRVHHRVEAFAWLVIQIARFLPHVDTFLYIHKLIENLNFDDDNYEGFDDCFTHFLLASPCILLDTRSDISLDRWCNDPPRIFVDAKRIRSHLRGNKKNYNWYFSVLIQDVFNSITYATAFSVIQNKALVAGAHETAERVGAMPVLTDVLVFLAFVDILEDDRLLIRSVSGTTRAQFLEFFRPNLGTLLATISPSVANAAATRRLRHRRGHIKDALRPSGTVFETDEAERFSSVCNGNNI